MNPARCLKMDNGSVNETSKSVTAPLNQARKSQIKLNQIFHQVVCFKNSIKSKNLSYLIDNCKNCDICC